MNLDDAIKHGKDLASRLKGRDAAAVYALVEMARKVRRVQKPLRQLEKALCPKEHLNQQSMLFSEGEPRSST